MSRPTIKPITALELPVFAQFLSRHLDTRTSPEGWVQRLSANWAGERPNYGLAVYDADTLVGGIGALYADRNLAGRRIRSCNITSWCVLESHRQQSMRLAMELVKDKTVLYTDFSPTKVVAGVLGFLKFTALDDTEYLVFNRPALPVGAKVCASPDDIGRLLTGDDAQAWRDHTAYPWLRHLAIETRSGVCYLVYKVDRFKGMPSAKVIHVSQRAVFGEAMNAVFGHLFWRGIATTRLEARFAARPPRLAAVRSGFNKKQFLGDGIDAGKVDYLYSESVAMDL